MLRIDAAVSVTNQTVSAKFILVRSTLAFDDRDGCETQWQIEQRGFEDTLRSDERDASAFEVEACLENRTG